MTDKMHIEIPLTTRMKAYQKDLSPRGQSLVLGQIILRLKEQFPEFTGELQQSFQALSKFRLQDDQKIFRIRKAMRQHAVEVDEIADDTDLPKNEVRRLLARMVTNGGARVVRREFGDAQTRSEQYFLQEFANQRECEQCGELYKFKSPLKRFCSGRCQHKHWVENSSRLQLVCQKCGNEFENRSANRKRCGNCWKGVKHGDDQG